MTDISIWKAVCKPKRHNEGVMKHFERVWGGGVGRKGVFKEFRSEVSD
jgi:hypothetical protein